MFDFANAIAAFHHSSLACFGHLYVLLNLQLPAGSLAHGCNGLVQTYKQVRSLQQFKQT